MGHPASPHSVTSGTIYLTPHRLSPPVVDEVLQEATDDVFRYDRPGNVWCYKYIVESPQWARRRQWFLREHIQHRTCERPTAERCNKGRLINDRTAPEVDEPARRFHSAEHFP